jgi:hypothetical protein
VRALSILLFACAVALPQSPQGGAIMRGILLERDAGANSGQFSLRASDSQVFRYRFDSTTYVENDSKVAGFGALKPGDRIEVISDADPHSALRYALMVRVLADAAPVKPVIQGRTASISALPQRLEYGAVTISGVALALSEGRMVLRLRDGQERRVLFRKDTRYLEDSNVVSPDSLKANMRVTVTGGETAYGDVEAYQILWGRIFHP